jgi:RNA polymerase sigma-70 factor (ECF subfamily)
MASVPEKPATVAGRAAEFPQTLWSIVLLAGQGESQKSHDALATLCRAYWFPLYAYLRRRGKSPHDAQDLTQGFLLHLVEKHTLSRAQPEKGKFRSFLLASLQYYLADERDKQRAQKRGGDAIFITLSAEHAEERYTAEPADELDPAKLFERRWALTLIEHALSRLEAEFEATGRKDRFEELQVFMLGEPTTISYAQAGERLGISEGAVKVAVLRLRQRFRELLRAEIASTVAEEEDIEGEMRHLFATLCG